MQVVLFCVDRDFSEVDLWGVPAADAVICPKISFYRKVISLRLVPFGQHKHILAFLMCEPRDRHLGLQRFIVPANCDAQ